MSVNKKQVGKRSRTLTHRQAKEAANIAVKVPPVVIFYPFGSKSSNAQICLNDGIPPIWRKMQNSIVQQVIICWHREIDGWTCLSLNVEVGSQLRLPITPGLQFTQRLVTNDYAFIVTRLIF